MRRPSCWLLAAAATALLAGCAKFPAGNASEARSLLDLRMTVRGDIDPDAYYLFVIDTNQDDFDGPEVIAPRTEFLGNGRATGAYTHYVEYHLGQFELFRDQPEQEGQTVPPREALGPPFFYDSSSSAGTLSVSIDLDQLKSNPNDPDFAELEINLITVNRILLPGELPIEPRQTDGLGSLGTSFLALLIEDGLIVRNNGIEEAGEVFEGQQLDPAYDLVDFQAAFRRGN